MKHVYQLERTDCNNNELMFFGGYLRLLTLA